MKKKTKKFKGFEFEDGRIQDYAYIDGYFFGDRLLEGVIFKITVSKAGTLKASPSPDHKEYMKKLNAKYWSEQAIAHAHSNSDGYSETEDGQGEELILI